MKRRSFLSSLASIPFVGSLVPRKWSFRTIDESHRAVIREMEINGTDCLRSTYPSGRGAWRVDTYRGESKASDAVVVARFLEMMHESGTPDTWPHIDSVEHVAEFLIDFRGLEDLNGLSKRKGRD